MAMKWVNIIVVYKQYIRGMSFFFLSSYFAERIKKVTKLWDVSEVNLGKNSKRLAPFCSLHKKFHDDDNEELFLQNRWSAKSVKSCLTGMTLEALDIAGLLHSAVIKRSLAVGWIGRHSWNSTGGSNGGTKMLFISYKKTTTRVDDRLDEDGVLRV